jgi:hypothetical protein
VSKEKAAKRKDGQGAGILGVNGNFSFEILIDKFFPECEDNIADDLVKNRKSSRSRAGGSPELLDLNGFPLPRE